MLQQCNPQIVEQTHVQTHSWRKAAQALNAMYGVHLSHATWRDYAKGRHDIADSETRSQLMLPPHPCPYCGQKNTLHKQNQQIRIYGYPTQRMQSFLDALSTREALR